MKHVSLLNAAVLLASPSQGEWQKFNMFDLCTVVLTGLPGRVSRLLRDLEIATHIYAMDLAQTQKWRNIDKYR